MNKLKKLYCRTFQTAFKIALPFLPYRKPKIVGSVKALPDFIKKKKCDHVLIITDAGIMKLGLTKRLENALFENDIAYTIYDKTVANPTTDNVAEALELYQTNGCNALIGFGGRFQYGLCQSSRSQNCKTEAVSGKNEGNPEST